MLDHLSVAVSDIGRSKAFYTAALATLGYRPLKDFGDAVGFSDGKGTDPGGDFWIVEKKPSLPLPHFAFSAATREEVDAFFAAAIAAGGGDNGPPGIRQAYHPHYYAAFVIDPDGYNIEAVCHAG
ncbi:VOC family protein [Rhizobiaceae bacterium BDR2-2]|uniref:VOC family protein n=1 Tax=Ectorhizobium quercum TaxID=2965071 RepID=A0AAE3MYJ1_9HYPH|nr:VOC family protein [Ectorhizobium quercum]MCX8996434.1 VOC family protein [Ectorhizobium quercum]